MYDVLQNIACSTVHTVSSDRSLLPLESISASSENSDDPAKDLVDTGLEEWCSTEALSSGPYIQLNFSQPIFLTHMRGRGGDGGFSYVTQFSIQVKNNGSFEQYHQPNEETVS